MAVRGPDAAAFLALSPLPPSRVGGTLLRQQQGLQGGIESEAAFSNGAPDAWLPAQNPAGLLRTSAICGVAAVAAAVLRAGARRARASRGKASEVLVLRAQASEAASRPRALLFDCDGVIVVSEELHRLAYNQVFKEFDTGVEWSKDYYGVLMNSVGGGKPKMRFHFTENGWPSSKLGPSPQTKEEQEALIDALQERKTVIFQENVQAGKADPRPGIVELIDKALDRPDLKTAVCSAATKSAVTEVLNATLGPERVARFDLLLLGDDVSKKKPDPLIYTTAAERLGVSPADCAVVEDSKIGLDAAVGASMRCFITYMPSTEDQDFSLAEQAVEDATRLDLDTIFPP